MSLTRMPSLGGEGGPSDPPPVEGLLVLLDKPGLGLEDREEDSPGEWGCPGRGLCRVRESMGSVGFNPQSSLGAGDQGSRIDPYTIGNSWGRHKYTLSMRYRMLNQTRGEYLNTSKSDINSSILSRADS